MGADPALTARAPRLAWRALSALVAAKLGLHFYSSGVAAYGHHADELYYLACAKRLAWGYVDHPPLSVALLRGVTALLGDSLLAIELLPALAGAATLVGTAWLARELGGGRGAQLCAATGGLFALVFLAMGSFHSMNAYEPLFFTAGYALVLRILRAARPALWLALGAVVGLGLLNKYSMGLFAIGLAVGLAATPERCLLATRGPWLAAGVAAFVFLPHAAWLVRHDFVSLEFLRGMREHSSPALSVARFAAGQLFAMSPLTAPVWIVGLAHGLLSRELRGVRPAFWIFVRAFALLAASGSAQLYYLAPAFPIVLAAGGVALERMRRGALGVATAAVVLGGLPLLPVALPLLPPETLVAYTRALGGDERTRATEFDSELPGHLALRFGWPELARAVAKAGDALPPGERARIAVLAPSFGEAAAVDFFGPALGLPPAAGTHNAYGEWGPPDDAGALLLVIADEAQPRLAHQDRPAGYRRGATPRELAGLCGDVERLASVDCRYCSPYVARKAVFACRAPKRPLAESWEDLRDTL